MSNSFYPEPWRTTTARPAAKTQRIEALGGPAELRTHRLGFKQVWPRPKPTELRAYYEQEFYEAGFPTYLEQADRESEFKAATWSLRRSMMEAALPRTRRRLLDIGASGGLLLSYFRQHEWEVCGIEPSRVAVRWARDRYGIELFCGELADYAAATAGRETFDAIHCAQVLEHVLDPEAFVAQLAALLAPGGIAYVEVPNDFNAFQEIARAELEKPAWWVAPDVHLNYFDPQSLAALLAEHGLEVEDRLASFPMELFLLMGDDYVGAPETGRECHQRRMTFEKTLFHHGHRDTLLDFYRALATASLGRTCGLLVRKPVQ